VPVPLVEFLGMFVDYEQWRCDFSIVTNPKGPCSLCAALNGQIFKKGYGPYPVFNTHPHCHCRRPFHHSEWFPPVILDSDDGDVLERGEGRDVLA